MTDVAIMAASIKTTLLEISKQAEALGLGLKNAAPNSAAPNYSVQYLLAIAENLMKEAEACDQIIKDSGE